MKVIIADGSAVVRAIIEQNLKKYDNIEITASVSNGKKVLKAAESEHPDVIISGTDMSDDCENDSFKVLCCDMHIPVLILSENSSAVPSFLKPSETMAKPSLKGYSREFFNSVISNLKKLTNDLPKDYENSNEPNGPFKILCIGASTGGPSAVSEVISGLGSNFPLVVLYTQHIEIGADKNMTDWLASVCTNFHVKLAENGEEAKVGTLYMAPADKHLVIDYINPEGNPVLRLSDEEPERFLRPAVNKLFRSAARKYKKHCLAVLLTGMGSDGADGCKEICNNGGWTIVEDKSTCAVFGMPAAAIEAGGAKEILPRGEIAKRILELAGE
ncbi:MAG: hypothetical protein J6Y75_01100 [Spirochaetaceae bacterium]|nr:hypothetical protein [Spirochaetaceae bacterium]MBP5328480.1 hypothetical protein [Spirochaetaceae bacterium]